MKTKRVEKDSASKGTVGINKSGEEVMDPKPMAIPTGFKKPLSIHAEMKQFIRSEVSNAAQAAQLETFEEADDFDIPGEDMSSPWEEKFDGEFEQNPVKDLPLEEDKAPQENAPKGQETIPVSTVPQGTVPAVSYTHLTLPTICSV